MPRFVLKDTYYKKAKKEGFRARSAYKLEEIQQKFNVIRKGDVVLDLGAAPGSWLQVESALVGDRGRVVGLDILPIQGLDRQNVIAKQGDIRETSAMDLLAETAVDDFDVITSDIAPNLSGIRDVDNAHIRALYDAVTRIVREALRKGGSFVIKLFFSPELGDMARDLQPLFARVVTFKPQASRGVSSEVYLVCLGKK